MRPHVSKTLRVLALASVLGLGFVIQSACLDESAAPELSGPSELGLALQILLDPDQLTADGFSSSVVEVVVRDENSNRVPGMEIRFDILQNDGNFADLGNLTLLNGARPFAGGVESRAVSSVSDSQGVARARYWAPFRTDQVNDGFVTIAAREASANFRNAFFRTADIHLRAADRPFFPGDSFCGIIREPLKLSYAIGEPVVFTATQLVGDTTGMPACSGNTIARYEWTITHSNLTSNEAIGRTATFSGKVAGFATIEVTTTEAGTACQTSCTDTITIR